MNTLPHELVILTGTGEEVTAIRSLTKTNDTGF